MKYKTLFLLALKAIGVITMLEGLHTILFSLAVDSGIAARFGGQYFNWFSFLSQPFVGVLWIGVGLHLFFGGRWIVNMAIPSNRPYCPECAYDLTGAPVERCPECGTAFRWEDVNPKIEVQSSKFKVRKVNGMREVPAAFFEL